MKNLLFFGIFLIPFVIFGQGYKIRIGGATGSEFEIDKIPAGTTFNSEIKTLEIMKIAADNPAKTYTLNSDNEPKSFVTDGSYHSVTFMKDIREIGLTINDSAESVVGGPFTLHKPEDNQNRNEINGTSIVMPKEKNATAYILNILFKDQIIDVEGVGLKIYQTTANKKRTTQFMGSKYIHLFFDQNGNSLIHSIPIGVARANYIVHIIFLVPKENPLNVSYDVNQSMADIEEGVVIRGEGGLQDALTLHAKELGKKEVVFEWAHTERALTASSYDIKFDIVRNGMRITQGNLEITDPIVVASKVVKMKRIYHGSVDIGIVKTDLENPTFTLVASDVDPSQMVVKKTDAGSRVMASAMFTFYLSPIVIIEKILMPSKVQNYKLEGRSFVDDHKIYERIYPTVGIGLNDRLLDNVFLGGKWEFIRGGSLFVGYHYGKVNVLNTDADFEFEKTYMTQSAFDLKTNTEWKGALALGLNLDVRIVTNLFQRNTAAGQ